MVEKKWVKVEGVIKQFKLDDVKGELLRIGILGMTVVGGDKDSGVVVRGVGQQKTHTELYRGSEYTLDYVPRIIVYVVVPEELGDKVQEAILHGARTDNIGDGIVYKTPIYSPRLIRDGRELEL